MAATELMLSSARSEGGHGKAELLSPQMSIYLLPSSENVDQYGKCLPPLLKTFQEIFSWTYPMVHLLVDSRSKEVDN